MSKKITINSLDSIKFLTREDSFLILPLDTPKNNNVLLAENISHYQKGKVILMGPPAPKINKDQENLENDDYKINIDDEILLDGTGGLWVHIANKKEK